MTLTATHGSAQTPQTARPTFGRGHINYVTAEKVQEALDVVLSMFFADSITAIYLILELHIISFPVPCVLSIAPIKLFVSVF